MTDAKTKLAEKLDYLTRGASRGAVPFPADAWAFVDAAWSERQNGAPIRLVRVCAVLREDYGIQLKDSAIRRRILERLGVAAW